MSLYQGSPSTTSVNFETVYRENINTKWPQLINDDSDLIEDDTSDAVNPTDAETLLMPLIDLIFYEILYNVSCHFISYLQIWPTAIFRRNAEAKPSS